MNLNNKDLSYVTVENLLNIVTNQLLGEYVLFYWNLDYPHQKPEVITSSQIEGYNGEFWLSGHEESPFPIDPQYDSGNIDHFYNDHYAFSLKLKT